MRATFLLMQVRMKVASILNRPHFFFKWQQTFGKSKLISKGSEKKRKFMFEL